MKGRRTRVVFERESVNLQRGKLDFPRNVNYEVLSIGVYIPSAWIIVSSMCLACGCVLLRTGLENHFLFYL